MKRIIMGMLLAAIAWMIGTEFNPWYCKWLGLAFGFISGLIFEDWKVTKEITAKMWHQFVSYEFDWKGVLIFTGTSFLYSVTIVGWMVLFVLTAWWLSNGKMPSYYAVIGTSVFSIVWMTVIFAIVVYLGEKAFNNMAFHNIQKLKIKAKEIVCLCFYINPISVLFFWIPYGIFRLIKNSLRIGQFLLYSFLELVAREKTLTFAICVTAGAGIGMLLGKTIICGLAASVLSGILILISDKTREIARQKLEMLKQNT